MKTDGGAITVLQLMISFLLVAITASGVVADQKEPVLDFQGGLVATNVRYFLGVQFGDRRMWVSRVIQSGFTCPEGVVMSKLPLTYDPVIFESSSDVLSVSTELNIKFARPSLCGGSNYWRIEDSSSPIKPVVLNGTKSSNDSTFTIQKFGGSYKLVFGSADKPTDIGLQKVQFQELRMILSNDSAFTISIFPARF